MHRRDFFKLSGGLFLGSQLASLFPFYARAANGDDPHMFLTIRVWGGMDCVLGLNPWTATVPDSGDLFLDEGYTFKTGVGGTQLNLGPSAFALEKFAHQLAVVNGVFMGPTDVGHPAAQNYITTAKGSPNVPHFIAELAEFFRRGNVNKQETILFNAELKTFDLNDLTRLPLQRLKQLALENLIPKEKVPFDSQPPLSEGDSTVARAQARIKAGRLSQEVFFAKYREIAKIMKDLGHGDAAIESELVAAAAFASDRAHFAQVDWSYLAQLDSHQNYPKEHQQSQKVAWDRLAVMLEVMSVLTHHKTGKAIFPHHATILVISEFSRLPYLNESFGKDHDFFDNSVLLGGRGIRGGRVIGENHLFKRDHRRRLSQLSGCHIDFKTGQVVKNGYYKTENVEKIAEDATVRLIRPENLLCTLAEVFSVDKRMMRLFSIDTPPVPGIQS